MPQGISIQGGAAGGGYVVWSPERIRDLGLRVSGGTTWGWQRALASAVDDRGVPCLPQDVNEFYRGGRRVSARFAEALDSIAQFAPTEMWSRERIRRLGRTLAGGNEDLIAKRLRAELGRRGYQTTRERVDEILSGALLVGRALLDVLNAVEADLDAEVRIEDLALVEALGSDVATCVDWTPERLAHVGRRLIGRESATDEEVTTILRETLAKQGYVIKQPAMRATLIGKRPVSKSMAVSLADIVSGL